MTVSLNELSSVYREFISEEDNTPEAVAQRVTQMVKAIRYRARKEASPLSKAFNDYIGSVNATSVERQAVKEKLGLTGGAVHKEEYVDEAKNVHGDIEVPKKNLGKLVKKAVKRIDTDVDGDVDKNDPSAGEFGEFVPKPNGKGRVYTGSKKVRNESSYYDPMEDPDFDHDEAEKNRGVSGKNNPKGGKALGKKKKNVKEGFSNWRQDLSEVMDEVEASKEIKEKKVKNKVVINPVMKEAIEELGGELLEMVELSEERNDEPGEGTKQKYGDMRGLDRSGAPTSFGGKWQSKERKAAGSAALAKLKKEETEIGEAVYGGEKKEPKDTRYTVTAADKKGNTEAYKRFKAGDKRYKAASHLGEENQIEEGIGMTMAKAIGNPPTVSKRMKLKQALVNREIAKNAEKNKEKSYSGKAAVTSEEVDLEEGMTLKDFKANRRKLKRREASTDAKKRGHVGKEWYNSGRTYSPDEAKSGRANMPDHERQTRHRSAVDPDNDNDDMYSADKTKNPKKLRKQKAMGELGEETLQEKALSKAQQRFMGMVYAVKQGKMKAPSAEVAKAASSMTGKEAKDFAKTKHKGLPEKKEVKEQAPEEMSLSPQELQLQRKKAQLNLMLAKARKQQIQKMK